MKTDALKLFLYGGIVFLAIALLLALSVVFLYCVYMVVVSALAGDWAQGSFWAICGVWLSLTGAVSRK